MAQRWPTSYILPPIANGGPLASCYLGKSVRQATKLQTTTIATDVLNQQATGMVDQNITNQNLIGKKVLPTSSLFGSAPSQDLDYDLEQLNYMSSPDHLMEEESGVSDQGTAMLEQELDQLRKEQNYWETIRCVRTFMGWHVVPEFESSASSQDDNPFVSPRTQPMARTLLSYLQTSNFAGRMINST